MNEPTHKRLFVLLDATSPTATAKIEQLFDSARYNYGAPPVQVENYSQWLLINGRFYAYLYGSCVARGAELAEFEACEQAKGIIALNCERDGLTLGNAYEDAVHGTNGGLYRQHDKINAALKASTVRNYVANVLDSVVPPTSWDAKVEITREVLAYFGPGLPEAYRGPNAAVRFAHDYKHLVTLVRESRIGIHNQITRT